MKDLVEDLWNTVVRPQEAVLVSIKKKNKEYALTTYSHRLDIPGFNMWTKAIPHLMWFREAERFNILV